MMLVTTSASPEASRLASSDFPAKTVRPYVANVNCRKTTGLGKDKISVAYLGYHLKKDGTVRLLSGTSDFGDKNMNDGGDGKDRNSGRFDLFSTKLEPDDLIQFKIFLNAKGKSWLTEVFRAKNLFLGKIIDAKTRKPGAGDSVTAALNQITDSLTTSEGTIGVVQVEITYNKKDRGFASWRFIPQGRGSYQGVESPPGTPAAQVEEDGRRYTDFVPGTQALADLRREFSLAGIHGRDAVYWLSFGVDGDDAWMRRDGWAP